VSHLFVNPEPALFNKSAAVPIVPPTSPVAAFTVPPTKLDAVSARLPTSPVAAFTVPPTTSPAVFTILLPKPVTSLETDVPTFPKPNEETANPPPIVFGSAVVTNSPLSTFVILPFELSCELYKTYRTFPDESFSGIYVFPLFPLIAPGGNEE